MSTLNEQRTKVREAVTDLRLSVKHAQQQARAQGLMTDDEYARRNVNLQVWYEAFEALMTRI